MGTERHDGFGSGARWWWAAALSGSGLLLYLLAPVLVPFLVAALLAYLANPAVARAARLGIPRGAAVALVFAAICAVLVLLPLVLVPLLERQIAVFVRNWPAYLDWLQNTAVPWLQTRLGVTEYDLDLGTAKRILGEQWREAGGIAAELIAAVSRSGLALLGWLANLVLIPVVTFYMLRDWDAILARLQGLIPRAAAARVTALARECDGVLGAFLHGQLWIMLALGCLYALGLWLVGLDVALLVGMGAGLVSFVPYLGPILGVLAAGIASVVQFHDLAYLLPILAVFAAGQLLEGLVLTPWLVGDRIGLHPLAVIFAVLAGGQLFSFAGVLLALPAAAVAAVLLRHARERYVASGIYGSDERPGPP